MNKVVINATASRTSGALTILKDFIYYCSSSYNCKKYQFYLFTSVDIFLEKDNLKIYKINEKSWLKRIAWDNGGLQSFCKREQISPDLIISLQNTCTKFPNIPQLIYYHQSLPLIPYKWNFLKKNERILFLYSHFYGYFVNKNNENAKYVVQLPYIKDRFQKKFNNIKDEDIFVIKPNNPNIDILKYKKEKHLKRFIYPATSVSYKNHCCILESLYLLKKQSGKKLNNFEVIFTIDNDTYINKLIENLGLLDIVKCIGSIQYDKLLNLYFNSDVLLFPSKIETYGMPLIEAASFGLPIIASDLPYAHEVLENYQNKVFCNPDNPKEWMQQIEKYCNIDIVRIPLKQNHRNTWEDFMEIVENILNK